MYGIRFTGNDAIPSGHDFMLVMCDEHATIAYREDRVTPRNLEDSWAAFRTATGPQYRPPGGKVIQFPMSDACASTRFG